MLMKFVLLSFAVAVAVAIERHVESDPCTPRSEFYADCNKCRCANDGNGAACTRQLCVPGEYNEAGVLVKPANAADKTPADDEFIVVQEAPERCLPGRTYKVDCNTCICSKEGRLACTLMGCIHHPKKRSIHLDYPVLPRSSCKLGKTYRQDCNTCFCGPTGVATCTTKKCNVDVEYYSRNARSVEKWGPRYEQGQSCQPGVKFFSECNDCVCGADGSSAACTLMMCRPKQ